MTEWCAIVGLHGLHDPPATMTHPRRGKGGCVIRMPSAIPRTDRIHVRYLCRGYGITTPPPTPLAKTHIPHGIRAPMGGSFRWNCVVYNTPPVGVSNVWTYPQFEAPEHLIPVGTHADATTHASSARMDGSRRKLSGGTSSRKVGDEQKCDDKPCVLYQPRSADSARL